MTETLETINLQTDQLRANLADLSGLADSFGNTIVRSFANAIVHGRKFSDVLKGLALSLTNMALSAALRPLGNMLGGLFSGRVTPFAQGGIVNSPTLFPMRGGAGLMGEAGPEAIVPLARGSDGRLGLRMAGGGGVQVTVNIVTPDAQSFRQSQSQVAALMARAIARGQRNL